MNCDTFDSFIVADLNDFYLGIHCMCTCSLQRKENSGHWKSISGAVNPVELCRNVCPGHPASKVTLNAFAWHFSTTDLKQGVSSVMRRNEIKACVD